MTWLISFAWASSSCKERKRDLQNEKFFLPTAGLELTTLWFWGHRLNRLAIHTGHVLKLNQGFPLLFKSSSEHVAECFVVYSVMYLYNICIILLTNIYKIIWVHRLNKSSLLVPRYGYVAYRDWIELPRLSTVDFINMLQKALYKCCIFAIIQL